MDVWVTTRLDNDDDKVSVNAPTTKNENDRTMNLSNNSALDHHWSALQHVRPYYCNGCTAACQTNQSNLTPTSVSCQVCKIKLHKHCLSQLDAECKWTTLASIGDDIVEDDDNGAIMPHQWTLGNLPVNVKCVICGKTCGSIRRLKDYSCLWCRIYVHASCRDSVHRECTLGRHRISILPPTSITNMDSDGYWQATSPPGSNSPLLVFINSKSGNGQGIRVLRRFKQLLNPAQVFDLINGGPKAGLRLFQNLESFRILVCGGDGSVSWVLNEIDRLGLQKQCQVGILPIGTGNDLAQILGWGASFSDDVQLSAVLDRLEHAQIKMLDRWSVYVHERAFVGARRFSSNIDLVLNCEDSVACHLSRILHSDNYELVYSSASFLCEKISDLVDRIARTRSPSESSADDEVAVKCSIIGEKLTALLETLKLESPTPSTQQLNPTAAKGDAHTSGAVKQESTSTNVSAAAVPRQRVNKQLATVQRGRGQLMCRANSLKKAIRNIIEHTEHIIDEQNLQTAQFDEHDADCDDSDRKELKIPTITTSPALDDIVESETPPPFHNTFPFSEFDRENNCTTASMSVYSLFAVDGGGQSYSGPETAKQSVTNDATSTNPLSVTDRQFSTSGDNLSAVDRSSFFGKLANSLAKSDEKCGEGSRRISSLSALNRKNVVTSLSSSPTPEVTSTFPLVNSSCNCRSSSISSGGSGEAIASNTSSAAGSFISKMLLANADALCAAASPLIEQEDIPMEHFEERCILNNYFGIGLDAKISLEFNNRRDDHPEKCQSRTRNLMFYGLLGGKEAVVNTFKNLEQRIRLECDGKHISLPNIQGLVILNIPSYMGGTNFWGNRNDDNFISPSFDDRILEVVAVFNSFQLGVSRVVNMQRHRIAQCRSVQITILGDTGVPVHVDGEAWIQPPSVIRIAHKNRAQMLTRDKVFEEALKTWLEKQRIEHPVNDSCNDDVLNDSERIVLQSFIDASSALIKSVKLASIGNSQVENDLLHLATQAASFQDRLYIQGQLRMPAVRSHVSDLVSSVRTLHQETKSVVLQRMQSPSQTSEVALAETFKAALQLTDTALVLVNEIGGLPQLPAIVSEINDVYGTNGKEKNRPKWRFMRTAKKGIDPGPLEGNYLSANEWTTEEVANWLTANGFGEYRNEFINNDIRGRELASLSRNDLKDLGITKVGHLKRIQQAIKDLAHVHCQH